MAISAKQAVKNADTILERFPKPTYSQPGRGSRLDSPQYDCSSFMAAIWNPPNGVKTSDGRIPSTVDMAKNNNENPYIANFGFTYIPYSAVLVLKRGDILVWDEGGGDNGHTGMVYDKAGTRIVHASGDEGDPVPTLASARDAAAWQHVLRPARQGDMGVAKW